MQRRLGLGFRRAAAEALALAISDGDEGGWCCVATASGRK
jgi:hypothetical protein